MNVLIFGAQGSGKSTHAQYIAAKLGIKYIPTGILLREIEQENSALGKYVKETLAKGELVKDEIMWEVIGKQIKGSSGFILDGYPRNFNQVNDLEKESIRIDLIILTTLDEKVAIRRLLARIRSDDTKEAIKKRLEIYAESTTPIIDYYRNLGVKYLEIDNRPPIGQVQREIDGLLKNR